MKYNLISFPRSGHHMTERLLREFYKLENIPYSYCEYYTRCCRTIPCKRNSKFQKNHDFDLSIEINTNQKYLFSYRSDKLEQLEAYYRFVAERNNENYAYSDLLKFCRGNSSYYNDLVAKYVDNKSSNILCIEYNDFLNNPSKTFHKIINFFELQYTLDYINNFIVNIDEKIYKRNSIDKSVLHKLTKDLDDIL